MTDWRRLDGLNLPDKEGLYLVEWHLGWIADNVGDPEASGLEKPYSFFRNGMWGLVDRASVHHFLNRHAVKFWAEMPGMGQAVNWNEVRGKVNIPTESGWYQVDWSEQYPSLADNLLSWVVDYDRVIPVAWFDRKDSVWVANRNYALDAVIWWRKLPPFPRGVDGSQD